MIGLTVVCAAALILALPVAAAPAARRDAFTLWQQGAFRGANVMLNRCNPEDLAVLRSWGANLAEIPVSNVYTATPPYAFQPEALDRLDQAAKAVEQAGLYVMLTCREGPGRADFNRSYEIWQDAAAQDAYAKMWREVASRFRGRPAVVGYCLMCEPHPERYATTALGDWNALARKITAAIREVDKRTPILVCSTGWAYPRDFQTLEPTGDPRTVYEVHFYDPHYYTHQKPDDRIAYPGFRLPSEPDMAWDKDTIRARLAPVREFQQKHHVPIFVGEFGVMRYAPGAGQWVRDQLDLYEEYGWSSAYWVFRSFDLMEIERTADLSDRAYHPDAPLLQVMKSYFARNRQFPAKP